MSDAAATAAAVVVDELLGVDEAPTRLVSGTDP